MNRPDVSLADCLERVVRNTGTTLRDICQGQTAEPPATIQ